MKTLVIGANRGIGLELAKQLKARGDDVIAACRKTSAELDALGVPVHEGAEITDPAAMASLAKSVGELEQLVVVSGILKRTSLDGLDLEVVKEQLFVNAVGPLCTVKAFEDNMARGSTIGLLTSRMGSMADNTSGGGYGYRMSKAALNMAGVSLAHDLKDREISVVLLHPGWVQTDMTGGTGHLTAEESAAGLIARLDEQTMENTGRFVHQSGEVLQW